MSRAARLEGQVEAERKDPKITVEKLHTLSASLAVFRDGRVSDEDSQRVFGLC